MFNPDFFPTKNETIDAMVYGIDLNGKTVLEPSGGAGHIVDYLKQSGTKEVISCEKHADLRKILQSKCRVISDDFMSVTSDMVSHIDCIIGNPPFSADDRHILHAFEIAPAGCEIVMLCNYATYRNGYSQIRQKFKSTIDENGSIQDLGSCFDDAERQANVKIGLVRLKKQGVKSESDFAGFFMDEEVEEQGNGIMPYNFVRDLVNRYVAAIRLFDEQIEIGVKMNNLTSSFFSSKLSFSCTSENTPILRNDFKKDLQKSAWNWVFGKMNMDKYATKGLRADINKFVENQEHVPFTMKNIYKMVEIVVGTTGARMDKAIIEVFDKLTEHYDENRYNVEGWKTNSHYLVNEKFIMPRLTKIGWHGELSVENYQNNNYELLADMVKALCFITGKNHDYIIPLDQFIRYPYKLMKDGEVYPKTGNESSNYSYAIYDKIESAKAAQEGLSDRGINVTIEQIKPTWGEWFNWSFFTIKCYKKGTCHIKFNDRDVWAMFNQAVCKIKGYVLPEGVEPKKKKSK
jgi:hypothetical protein